MSVSLFDDILCGEIATVSKPPSGFLWCDRLKACIHQVLFREKAINKVMVMPFKMGFDLKKK
jgi:hypothetical protein